MNKTNCDCCKSINIVLTTRNVGNWPYIWLCNDCGACVGCKLDSTEPLGFMAQGKLRLLRRIAHIAFDDIWLTGLMSRERAKRWMASELELECEFHISQLGFGQLRRVIKLSNEYLQKHTRNDIEQLKSKQHDKHTRTNKRTARNNAIYARRRKSKR